MLDNLIDVGIFIVGGICGMGLMGLIKINKVDVKAYSYKLRHNIISDLIHFKSCWQHLTEVDNLYLQGGIEAMKVAIGVVTDEFDKAESEVDGK